MLEHDINDKVYEAQGGMYSIIDLLRTFADSEMQTEGISRISDLHMKVGEPVRYRFDGELETIAEGVPLTKTTLHSLVFPLLSEKQRESLTTNTLLDIDAGYTWEEEKVNFRLNVFHDRDGMACVIRMLPKHIPEIDELGFMNASVWQDITTLKQGLVLVNGVTSSGKSTTIASIIEYINKSRKARIITLEDPIEFVFRSEQSLISQRELGKHLSDFPNGLRSALRENPDIIYVGEIRDAVTAQLALTAAETGHLVFSTMHTKDVKGTFSRFVDMFPADHSNEIATQLSFSLAFAINQKLLARESGKGRIPAFEVLKNNSALANLIRTSNYQQIYSQMETGVNEGMNTLEQHLIGLVAQGLITKEEAISHANDTNIVSRLD
jgi:twitching motility protein PilT